MELLSTQQTIIHMTSSETIKNISTALLGFHRQVRKIGKTATNPFFKSNYADLPSILEAIREPLIDNDLIITQFPEGNNGLTTRLIHTSGEWMESTYYMTPSKNDPQGQGSAITYQRRYAIGAILSLNIDKDDDGNSASGNTPPHQSELKLLEELVYNSDLNGDEREKAFEAIKYCKDYKTYELIQHRLEARALPIDQIKNPSQKDLNKHIKKITS
jgi:hypothetical protein